MDRDRGRKRAHPPHFAPAKKEHFWGPSSNPYERAVFSTAYSIVGNAADAEDVAQEAFLKALKHLAGFRAEARFSTWLIQITLNEARLFPPPQPPQPV